MHFGQRDWKVCDEDSWKDRCCELVKGNDVWRRTKKTAQKQRNFVSRKLTVECWVQGHLSLKRKNIQRNWAVTWCNNMDLRRHALRLWASFAYKQTLRSCRTAFKSRIALCCVQGFEFSDTLIQKTRRWKGLARLKLGTIIWINGKLIRILPKQKQWSGREASFHLPSGVCRADTHIQAD